MMLPALFVNTAERYLLMSSSCFIKLSVITPHPGAWWESIRPPPTGEKEPKPEVVHLLHLLLTECDTPPFTQPGGSPIKL